MSAIPSSAADEVRDSLARLRTMLAAGAPGHQRPRPLHFRSGSPGLRDLWAAIGWSPAIARAGIAPPSHEDARAYASRTLADYRSWGEGLSLTLGSLPRTFRVVEEDTAGVGFAFADETGRPYDPPLRMVSTDAGRVVPLYDSTLQWIANRLVPLAFAGWHRTWVALDPVPSIRARPFPRLSPATLRVDDDLVFLPSGPDARKLTRAGTEIAHRSFARLVTFLHSLPKVRTLELNILPGTCFELTVPAHRLDARKWARLDDLRAFRDPDPERSHRVGYIAGEPAIVSIGPYLTTLAVDPKRAKRVRAILTERGWGWR